MWFVHGLKHVINDYYSLMSLNIIEKEKCEGGEAKIKD